VARILVALDDSDGSARAAEFVQSFFGPLDVEVVALSVARRAVPWIPAGTSYGLTYPWAGAMSHGVTVDRLAQAEH
jgi:hypothetical protein